MKKLIILVALTFVFACGTMFWLAADTLTMVILIAMSIVLMMGFFLGIVPTLSLGSGFKRGRLNIEQALDVQSTETWLAVQNYDSLFRNTTLDNLFRAYKEKVAQQQEDEEIISDIEEYITPDILTLRTWQSFISQVPGTLTGLGILGTFIGLIFGISSIGFSSVDAALESIESLLDGIQTAFFTSIAGVVLSITFNIFNRLIWNAMLREYGFFVDSFHKNVIPSTAEQMRTAERKYRDRVIDRLNRLPKDAGYSLANPQQGGAAVNNSHVNEQILMPQVRAGLEKGEFTFYLQPRMELATKKIIGSEALVRWNHETMGLLTPGYFVPLLESNGYITRLDAYIWEEVCKTVRRWIDSGMRPGPVAINISKTDILAMDVSAFFASMLEKYHLPPRLIELEIAKNAYVQNPNMTGEVAGDLRRQGFRVVMDGFDGDFISVNMLENAEVDVLKLDLRYSASQAQFGVDAIFEQAKKLGVEMWAEGIENSEQVSTLKRLGCSYGQGYYFHKPISIADFEAEVGKA